MDLFSSDYVQGHDFTLHVLFVRRLIRAYSCRWNSGQQHLLSTFYHIPFKDAGEDLCRICPNACFFGPQNR